MAKSDTPGDWLRHFADFGIRYRLRDEHGTIAVTTDPPPLTPLSHVQLFENVVQHRLPRDYREFLRAYGDAYACGAVFTNRCSPGGFYGLRSNSGTSLIARWCEYLHLLPASTIPIVDDVGNGGTICLALGGASQGQVLWYHAEAGLEVVAPDFRCFLSSMRLDTD